MKTKSKSVLVVGVTGGIGSGKSEVCRIFQDLGAVVLSADRIAREIIDSDRAVKEQIEKVFGEAAYGKDGLLNRRQIAERIFMDQQLRTRFNKIVHPPVLELLQKQILGFRLSKKFPLVVVEAALIYEAHAEKLFDVIIVVIADEQMQVKRISDRYTISRHEAMQRIGSQLPSGVKALKANFVIRNNGSLELLKENCKFLFRVLTLLLLTSEKS